MLDKVMIRYLEAAWLKSFPALLATHTGISERRLRSGPAHFRTSTLARGEARNREVVAEQLAKCGLDEKERQDWFDRHPRGLTAGVVYETEIAGRLEYPETRAFAERIDALGAAFDEARAKSDLGYAKRLLLDTDWLDRRYFSETSAERSSGMMPKLLGAVSGATTWEDLHQPRAVVVANLLFSLLALWDAELRTKCLWRLPSRSVFSLLLPYAETDGTSGRVPRRPGMWHLPVRRLLDLVYALAAFRPDRPWQVGRPRVKTLAQRTNETEQTLVNWRDGTKRFGHHDFDRVWNAMFRAHRPENTEKSDRTAPLVPLFVAATIFQDLLVNVDSRSPTKHIYLVDGAYSDWWAFHAAEVEGAKAKAGASRRPPWLLQA